MQKTTIEIRGLIAILGFLAVEKRLRAMPGVASVAMNASSTATATFDEAAASVDAIMRQVEACGFHCEGESVPRHVCTADCAAVPPSMAAWRALRNGVLNMAVLVVLGVGTGYLFSAGATWRAS